jgi:hypothetical protein
MTLISGWLRPPRWALAEQRLVSPVEVLLGLGWLTPSHLGLWCQRRVERVERLIYTDLNGGTLAEAEAV